jgi:hypothetical protein
MIPKLEVYTQIHKRIVFLILAEAEYFYYDDINRTPKQYSKLPRRFLNEAYSKLHPLKFNIDIEI